MNLSSSLDIDSITIHLKAIQNFRCLFFTSEGAIIKSHREAIDHCIGVTQLPYEIKEALKGFYRTETLSKWLFYKEHIDYLLETEYRVSIFYWSTVDYIKTYSDMYLYHNLGLVDEDDIDDKEYNNTLSIPTIMITLH